MLAAVLADFGRPLQTFRIELPVASIFIKRLSTPPLNHLLDGNSLNNFLELHFFSIREFSIKILSFKLILPIVYVVFGN